MLNRIDPVLAFFSQGSDMDADADDDDFLNDDFYIPGENEDLLAQWEEMLPPCQLIHHHSFD